MLKFRNFRIVLENTEISGSVEEIKNFIDFVLQKTKKIWIHNKIHKFNESYNKIKKINKRKRKSRHVKNNCLQIKKFKKHNCKLNLKNRVRK